MKEIAEHVRKGAMAYLKQQYKVVQHVGDVGVAFQHHNGAAARRGAEHLHGRRSRYYVGELNGKSSKQAYMDALHISESNIINQTFHNPLGKMNGQDICIISLKEVSGNGLCCYRQVNDSDVLVLLEEQDYNEILDETLQRIRRDFNHISGVFSINCVFRYLLFSQEHHMEDYLKTMSTLGDHAGLIGFGEHYNQQFVNQTMTCVVFE